jgi:hypothetical protein
MIVLIFGYIAIFTRTKDAQKKEISDQQ